MPGEKNIPYVPAEKRLRLYDLRVVLWIHREDVRSGERCAPKSAAQVCQVQTQADAVAMRRRMAEMGSEREGRRLMACRLTSAGGGILAGVVLIVDPSPHSAGGTGEERDPGSSLRYSAHTYRADFSARPSVRTRKPISS